MSRLRLLPLAAAAVVALTAAGCGGSSSAEAPQASALVTDTMRAMRAQKPPSVQLRMTADAAVKPGPKADAEVRRFTDNPLKLELSGGFSDTAIDGRGSAQALGQSFSGRLLAGPKELYVNFLGAWYGTKEFGLEAARQQRQEGTGKSNDQAFREALAKVEKYGNQVFDGEVTEGPEVEGKKTWKAEGSLNPDGIARVAEQEGERLTAPERKNIDTLARGTKVLLVTGQDDKLPRRFQLTLDVKASDLEPEDSEDRADLEQVDTAKVTLDTNMTKWGQKVSIKPPPDFKPITELLGQFFGGAGGAGGPSAQ